MSEPVSAFSKIARGFRSASYETTGIALSIGAVSFFAAGAYLAKGSALEQGNLLATPVLAAFAFAKAVEFKRGLKDRLVLLKQEKPQQICSCLPKEGSFLDTLHGYKTVFSARYLEKPWTINKIMMPVAPLACFSLAVASYAYDMPSTACAAAGLGFLSCVSLQQNIFGADRPALSQAKPANVPTIK